MRLPGTRQAEARRTYATPVKDLSMSVDSTGHCQRVASRDPTRLSAATPTGPGAFIRSGSKASLRTIAGSGQTSCAAGEPRIPEGVQLLEPGLVPGPRGGRSSPGRRLGRARRSGLRHRSGDGAEDRPARRRIGGASRDSPGRPAGSRGSSASAALHLLGIPTSTAAATRVNRRSRLEPPPGVLEPRQAARPPAVAGRPEDDPDDLALESEQDQRLGRSRRSMQPAAAARPSRRPAARAAARGRTAARRSRRRSRRSPRPSSRLIQSTRREGRGLCTSSSRQPGVACSIPPSAIHRGPLSASDPSGLSTMIVSIGRPSVLGQAQLHAVRSCWRELQGVVLPKANGVNVLIFGQRDLGAGLRTWR